MTDQFAVIELDSRPMFNGEYRSFIKILQLKPNLDGFLSIGAREDNFYLDLLCHKKCVLVEPEDKSASVLEKYINKWALPNKFVERNGIHPSKSVISVNEFGSIYPRKSLLEIRSALDSGLIICPITKQHIEEGNYREGAATFSCPCIKPIELLSKYQLSPDFLKVDVEGAERLIIEDIIKAGIRPSFIQYEYGITWFHAGETMAAIFSCMPNYYHYILTPNKMRLITTPVPQYFYANFVASSYYLGDEVIF
jgi:FkbM family methyltransferase